MERAVRMKFANIVFDTWVEGGQGQASLRRALSGLMARLARSPGPPAHSLQLHDQAGLLCVTCADLTADLEAVRHERASAVFSIGPAGETRPLALPGMIAAPTAPSAMSAQVPVQTDPCQELMTATMDLRAALAVDGRRPEHTQSEIPATPQTLALDFAAPDGRPMARYRVRLQWQGNQLDLQTDDAGRLDLVLPPSLDRAELTLFLSDEPGHALCWSLERREQPLGELACARQALHLLGYPSGSLAPHFDLGLAQALAQFQTDMGLEPCGALDPETAALLAGEAQNP